MFFNWAIFMAHTLTKEIKMNTEQEQKILDNAPDGATHYSKCDTKPVYYKDITAISYLWHFGSWCNGSGEPCNGLNPLADLSDKQGKTVVELFDGCKYSFYVNDKPYIGIYKIVREAFFNADTGNKICGSFEAVDIKLKSDPNAPDVPITPLEPAKPRTEESAAVDTLNNLGYKWHGGEQWKPPLVKVVKPRMKVDYVKLTGDFWEVAKEYQEGKLFYKLTETGIIDTLEQLVNLYKSDNIYRKVETEITREQELFFECEQSLKEKSGKSFVSIGEASTIQALIKSGNIK
jgi:hypothetical protein